MANSSESNSISGRILPHRLIKNKLAIHVFTHQADFACHLQINVLYCWGDVTDIFPITVVNEIGECRTAVQSPVSSLKN